MNNTNEIITGLELARMLLAGDKTTHVLRIHRYASATTAVNAAIKELQRIPEQEDLQDTSRADAEHIDGMDSETKYWMKRALDSETEVKRLEDREVGERLAQYEDAEMEACENLSENSVLTEDQIAQMWSPHPEGTVRRPILGWNKVVDFARNVERAVVLSAKAEVRPSAPCSGPWPEERTAACKESFKKAFDKKSLDSCEGLAAENKQAEALRTARGAIKELEAQVFALTQQREVLQTCLAQHQRDAADPPSYLQAAVLKAAGLNALAEELAVIRNRCTPAAATSASSITDDQIREVFLKAGFTIKPGQDDLKPYVFEAARALLALASNKVKGN